MAKRIRREEKREAPDVASQSRFIRWIENFWYHYKWQTILVVSVLLVLIIGFAQCSSNETTDATVTLAASYSLTEAQMDAVKEILETALPMDYDGSGDKAIAISTHLIHSEEQLRALNTYLDENGKEQLSSTDYQIDKYHNTDRYKTLQNFVMTGESGVWLVSPYVYGELLYSEDAGSNWVREATPLKDTALYRQFDALKALPEDTLVVLTVQPVFGTMADDEAYAQAVALYNAILSYSAS